MKKYNNSVDCYRAASLVWSFAKIRRCWLSASPIPSSKCGASCHKSCVEWSRPNSWQTSIKKPVNETFVAISNFIQALQSFFSLPVQRTFWSEWWTTGRERRWKCYTDIAALSTPLRLARTVRSSSQPPRTHPVIITFALVTYSSIEALYLWASWFSPVTRQKDNPLCAVVSCDKWLGYLCGRVIIRIFAFILTVVWKLFVAQSAN